MTHTQDWLTSRELAQMLRVSTRELRERLRKRPDFPRPYRISPLRCLWVRVEVEAWIESRRTEK